MIELINSGIPGCFELRPKLFQDPRGRFVKIFHKDYFLKHGLSTDFAEEYYSHSFRGVIRGLHFQTPPHDHVKMVYCVSGEVFDVVVDLRIGSPTYGKCATFILNAEDGNCLYIPKGLAHGFCVTSETATLVYKVGTTYSPDHDSGIKWSSVDVDWPTTKPTISERDEMLVTFDSFKSPFLF